MIDRASRPDTPGDASAGSRRGAPAERVRVVYCLGTRPEVIRSARLLQLLRRDPNVVLTVVSSGQHYDSNMFSDFFAELEVPQVHENLGVGGLDSVEQTSEIMQGAGTTFARYRPDIVCVFGDTNSSLAFALASVKLYVPVIHVEAGCRSHDMSMPEEVNRRLIDHCASLLLAVSELGALNLRDERVAGGVEVVGDPLFDVYCRIPERGPEEVGRGPGLLTLHRPPNVDDVDRLHEILFQVAKAAAKIGIEWLFPAHPRTRRSLCRGISKAICVVDPLPYSSLRAVLRSAPVCVTDSGGLQKEALWAEVPCVTIRPNTEWMETVWQHANVLAPPGSDIASAIIASVAGDRTPDFSNPYGDGYASERIVATIKRWFLADAVRSGRGVPGTPRVIGGR